MHDALIRRRADRLADLVSVGDVGDQHRCRFGQAAAVGAPTQDVDLVSVGEQRPTAATVLLVLGVPQRAVMDLMGWANSDMAKRYQHLTDEVRTDIAERVGSLLWSTPDCRGHQDME